MLPYFSDERTKGMPGVLNAKRPTLNAECSTLR